jgi:hypothetical protein
MTCGYQNHRRSSIAIDGISGERTQSCRQSAFATSRGHDQSKPRSKIHHVVKQLIDAVRAVEERTAHFGGLRVSP